MRRRLNLNLQRQLLRDHNDLSPRPDISDLPALELEHPDYSYADICCDQIGFTLEKINNEKSLESWSKTVIPELTRVGILKPDEPRDMTDLQITKAFLESQITHLSVLAKRAEGDFLHEEQIVSGDFGQTYDTPDRPIKSPEPPDIASGDNSSSRALMYSEAM